MKQVNENPTHSREITLSTKTFTGTGPSGVVTLSGSESTTDLTAGDGIILTIGGGTGGGYTTNKEYYIFDIGASSFKVTESKSDAINGVDDLTLSGDVGSGTVNVLSKVGGVTWIGTSGDLNMRGIGNGSEFVIHKNITNGSLLPFMIKDICPSGTTAGDIVAWDE